MPPASFIWRKFEWEEGGQTYAFEVSRTGGKARLKMPGQRQLELPMGVWAALSEAIRRADVQERRAGLPARAGTSWTESEHTKMVTAFTAGTLIPDIARMLDRTEGAIIARLASVGLIDRETYSAIPPTPTPTPPSAGRPRSQVAVRFG